MLTRNGRLNPDHLLPLSTTTPVSRDVDWQRLARANTHHLRVSILEAFGIDGGRTMSASDLSYELQTALPNVNYHLTELAKQRLVTLSHRKRVRGATEHFYRLARDRSQPRTNGGSGKKGRPTGVEPATSPSA